MPSVGAKPGRIPLVHNGKSVFVINEHHGEVIYLKWNPMEKMLATGGHNDNYVDVWDFAIIGSHIGDNSVVANMIGTSASTPKSVNPRL